MRPRVQYPARLSRHIPMVSDDCRHLGRYGADRKANREITGCHCLTRYRVSRRKARRARQRFDELMQGHRQ